MADHLRIEEAVERAYEDHRSDVYYYLLTLGLRPSEAQDAVQDAFMRLYIALRNGEDILNPRAWVFRVGHNLAVNVVTRRKESGPVDERHPMDSPNPEQWTAEKIRNEKLAEALEGLSPQQRHCLHLRAEGLRYREIAEVLGVTTSTVNEFVRRAVSKLKKVLHE